MKNISAFHQTRDQHIKHNISGNITNACFYKDAVSVFYENDRPHTKVSTGHEFVDMLWTCGI